MARKFSPAQESAINRVGLEDPFEETGLPSTFNRFNRTGLNVDERGVFTDKFGNDVSSSIGNRANFDSRTGEFIITPEVQRAEDLRIEKIPIDFINKKRAARFSARSTRRSERRISFGLGEKKERQLRIDRPGTRLGASVLGVGSVSGSQILG